MKLCGVGMRMVEMVSVRTECLHNNLHHRKGLKETHIGPNFSGLIIQFLHIDITDTIDELKLTRFI